MSAIHNSAEMCDRRPVTKDEGANSDSMPGKAKWKKQARERATCRQMTSFRQTESPNYFLGEGEGGGGVLIRPCVREDIGCAKEGL
jgi:hypothetical protein